MFEEIYYKSPCLEIDSYVPEHVALHAPLHRYWLSILILYARLSTIAREARHLQTELFIELCLCLLLLL